MRNGLQPSPTGPLLQRMLTGLNMLGVPVSDERLLLHLSLFATHDDESPQCHSSQGKALICRLACG